jgi:hypothetical protein
MELMEMLSEQSQNLVLMLTFFFCIITLVQQRQTQIELREIKLQTQIDLREIKLQTQIGFKEIREGVPLREFLVQSPCCLVTSPKHVPLLK